jgi:hypothetical protein
MLLPGDKVSFINERLNGTVKRIIDKKQVLLLLDDGFEFPANINELVLKERAGGKEQEQAKKDTSIVADEVDVSDKLYFGTLSEDTGKGILIKAYLVNTTPHLLLFALFNTTGGIVKGIMHGVLEHSRALSVFNFALSEYEQYRNLALQAIRYVESADQLPAPEHIPFRLKQVSLLKENTMIPVIRKQGYLVNLSDLLQGLYPDPKPLKETVSSLKKPDPVPDIIDLHLEELTDSPKGMMPHAALELQMKVFQNSLEKALAQDLKQVTFIHGVGQGRLKQEIRKSLGINPFVQGFDDADHKKFGYGATIVFLKSR